MHSIVLQFAWFQNHSEQIENNYTFYISNDLETMKNKKNLLPKYYLIKSGA